MTSPRVSETAPEPTHDDKRVRRDEPDSVLERFSHLNAYLYSDTMVDSIKDKAADTIGLHLQYHEGIVHMYEREAVDTRKQAAQLIARADKLDMAATVIAVRVRAARNIALAPYPSGSSLEDDISIVDMFADRSCASAFTSGLTENNAADDIIDTVFDTKFTTSVKLYREFYPIPTDAAIVHLRVYADKTCFSYDGNLDFVRRDGVWSSCDGIPSQKVGEWYVYDDTLYIGQNDVACRVGSVVLSYDRWIMWTDEHADAKSKHADKESRK